MGSSSSGQAVPWVGMMTQNDYEKICQKILCESMIIENCPGLHCESMIIVELSRITL